jgi:hypothetical protein
MSILNHPYKNEAYSFKALLPLYASSPKIFKAGLRRLSKRRYGLLHKIVYVLSIPLLEKKEFFYRFIRIPLIYAKTLRVLRREN